MKKVWKCIAVFAGGLALLWLCLVISACIPNHAIQKNMEESALSYMHKDAFSVTDGQKLCSASDNYADVILLGISWNMGTGNPVTSSINTQYYDGNTYGENYGLYATVKEGEIPNTDYTRYWHGMAIFVRLFHLFTDADGIKIIGFVAICGLLVLNLFLLFKRKHYGIAAAFLISFCLVQFWHLHLSLEYQPAFLLSLVLCPIFLQTERKGNGGLILLSVVSGTAIAFFDFLTTETVTVLLPLMLVISVRAKENRFGTLRENVPMLVKCGMGWFLSYSGTFLIKWSAASLIMDQNVFQSAVFSAAERFGGAVQAQMEQPTNIFSSVLANLAMPFGNATRTASASALVGTAVFCLLVFSVWYIFRHGAAIRRDAVVCLFLLGAVVFVRFFVLYNHSFVHAFFTYRALVVPCFALLAAAALHMHFPLKKGKKTVKK